MSMTEYDFASGRIVELSKRKAIILIADTNEADPLVAFLRGARYRMLGLTSNTSAALELARKHKEGLIFIDADIPGIDVQEVLSHLKRRLPDFKPIMIGRSLTREAIVLERSLGAVGFLSKPLEEDTIRQGMGRLDL